MWKTFCAGLLISGLLWTASAQSLTDDSRAIGVWEKAVSAKGGRELLKGISTFLVVERHRRPLPFFLRLYVFPDKYWTWDDYGRNDLFGANLDVNDGVRSWEAYERRGTRGTKRFSPEESGDGLRPQSVALFLLETRWYQPKILGLTAEKIGREEFDVVTVDAGRDKVKYYIDRRTSLIRRASPVKEYGNVVTIPCDFYDYASKEGIMMPSRMKCRDQDEFLLEFGFNVEYDPVIFTRQPTLEDGPDGWKPSKPQRK